jgi:iron complex outermembrane recepter protein
MTNKQYPARWLAVALSPLCLALSTPARADPGVSVADISDASYPVVITPTRLKQSLDDVPASVTIITGDTLRRYGITRIEEALRFVPGMAVTLATGNDYRINYHGTRSHAPRRMNVLIDGQSMYMPAFSQVEWSLLPVALEDVDRIEVIRGPDSASYGPNSMMAVVNILTKHPKDVEPALMSVTADTRGALDTTARMAGTIGGTSVRLTANAMEDRGYDTINHKVGHDGMGLKRLNLRAQRDLADGSQLDLSGSYLSGKREFEFYDTIKSSTYPDHTVEAGRLGARWSKSLSSNHELQVSFSHSQSSSRQYWNPCFPPVALWLESRQLFLADPALARELGAWTLDQTRPFPTPNNIQGAQALQAVLATANGPDWGGFQASLTPTICGTTNQNGDDARTQVEVQDTYVANDHLRLVGGAGWRRQRAQSQTFFGGTVANNVGWLFGHAEVRVNDWLVANLGGYGEHNTLSGNTFSPRGAVNIHLSNNQTIRAAISRGTRTPDLFEERANWTYQLSNTNVPVYGQNTASLFSAVQAKGKLQSERILSRELGYLAKLPRAGLTLDVRLFDERLTHLISQPLTLQDFAPDNANSVRLTGAEIQTQWELSNSWSGWLSYGYLLNRDATTPYERSQYSRHSGGLGASYALSDQWRASLAHFGSTGDGGLDTSYGRTDLTLSYAFASGKQLGQASLTVRHLATPNLNYQQGTGTPFTSSYDRRTSIQGQVRLAF